VPPVHPAPRSSGRVSRLSRYTAPGLLAPHVGTPPLLPTTGGTPAPRPSAGTSQLGLCPSLSASLGPGAPPHSLTVEHALLRTVTL